MIDGKQAAERLALVVWDFLAQYHNDPASITDDNRAAIRSTAFRFSREIKPADEWQVTLGRQLAFAFLLWADNPCVENFRSLERCSRRYEDMRINPPTI